MTVISSRRSRALRGCAVAAAGAATLIVRNRSAATCRTFGYVGLQLLAKDGASLPTNAARVRPERRRRFRLQPGDHAFADLRWSAIPGPGEPGTACQPAPARLEVTPPDDTRQLTIAWPDGPACQGGRIEVEPLHDRR